MSPPGTRRRRKQDRDYWDRMAVRWDAEIFNTLHHDKFRVIAGEIARSGRRARSIADFGCGTGIYLPLLSRLFDDVHGFERSRACVAVARKKLRAAGNVAIHAASSAELRRHHPFDVVLCVNVAVHPIARARVGVLRAVRALLAPGGRLILVVPSLESATLVAEAERKALRDHAGRGAGDWNAEADAGGVVTIEGMPYKHYARGELRDLLVGLGFTVPRISRVQYSWRSQGVRPGAAFRDMLPWDWIAVARRRVPAVSRRAAS